MARQSVLDKNGHDPEGPDSGTSATEGVPLSIDPGQASRNPHAFFAGLDWAVETDLSVLSEIDAANGPASPFQSEAWLQAALEAGGGPGAPSLHIVCARANQIPLIVLPLCGRRRSFGYMLSFLGQRLSDYNGPILSRGLAGHANSIFMEALWEKVGRLLPQADLLSLRKLLAEPSLPRVSPTHIWSEEPEQGHWLDITGSWEESQDSLFGKSSRKSLSRKAKKLAALGELDCIVITDPEQRLSAIDRLAKWKSVQLEELGSANPFRGDGFSNFLKSAIRHGAPEHFRICQLSAGETPLALTLMLCDDERWFLYQTAFTDSEEGRYSPGLLLLRDILKRAHDAGVKVFDFGLGNEGYKRKYCNHEQILYRQLVAFSTRGKFAMAAENWKFRLRTLAASHAAMRKLTLAILRATDRRALP